ncbi:MAG: GAF domain-containing protein [Cyclobacteriaceae bacterium]
MNIDLSNCEKEPIHLVNAIQDFGYFLRLRYFDLEVIGGSSNLISHGHFPSFESLFGDDLSFRDWLRDKESDQKFVRIHFQREDFEVALTKKVVAEEEIHLEFEPFEETSQPVDEYQIRSRIAREQNLENLGQCIVETIHQVTGFDRIMLYKFDEEYNGHVVNEKIVENSPLTGYWGHRFPASDIPAQARLMLEMKLTRLILDVEGQKVAVRYRVGEAPLDMTYSEYRYPSEIHLEYLKNMKVRSTFTISLLYHGRLWGLIACHHPIRLLVPPFMRNICERIAESASIKIRELVDHQTEQNLRQLEVAVATIKRGGSSGERLLDEICCRDICSTFHADFYFYYKDGMLVDQSEKEIKVPPIFHEWVQLQSSTGIFYSNSTYTYVTEEVLPDIAGVMVLPIREDQKLILCRSVYPEVMKWAGNPDKAVAGLDALGRISPRKSFETWVGDQNKLSASWEYHLIETARILVLSAT